MSIRNAGLNPLTFALLTSILSAIFVILDAFAIFKTTFPAVFFVFTLVLVILFIYSKIPSLYRAPQVSVAAFFLFGILLLVESIAGLDLLPFEGIIFILSGLILFYLVVSKGVKYRVPLCIILLSTLGAGIYLLLSGTSVFWLM